MKKSIAIWIAFAAVVVTQWAAPLSMIFRSERVLSEGQAFKFKTAPVDPYDAFRGRYIALSFADAEVPINAGEDFAYNTEVYATLETGPDGYAKFTRLSQGPPAAGAYLKVRTMWRSPDNKMHLTLPFDKYFMPESLAPQAEDAYRKHNLRSGPRDAYAVVRVRAGVGVIENVFLGDKPILDVVQGR